MKVWLEVEEGQGKNGWICGWVFAEYCHHELEESGWWLENVVCISCGGQYLHRVVDPKEEEDEYKFMVKQ